MTFPQIAIIGLVLGFSSFLTSTVGFAFGLFSIPVLVWLGISLPNALVMVTVAVFFQTMLSTWMLREEIQWRKTLPMIILRICFMPLGLLALIYINQLDLSQVKLILGLIVIISVVAQYLWKVKPRDHLHPLWGLLAFSLSGFITGLSGMGGPPIVLWVMAHRWTNQQTRVFLFLATLTILPIQLPLMYLKFGNSILHAALIGLIFSPLILLAAACGLSVGNRIPKPLLRQVALAILTLIALASILSPLIS